MVQTATYYESPSPHVVIEEFLSPKAAKACLAEAISLEPVFEPAGIIAETDLADDCEICLASKQNLRNTVRSNQIVYMDRHYKDQRYKSVLLQSLQETVTANYFTSLMRDMPALFPIANQTHSMETMLSQYGMCDFYGWHKDAQDTGVKRILTIVYHMNTEPQEYVGGELILAGKSLDDRKVYQPEHNRAIIFQSSQCYHAVNTCRHEGAFKDSRFSINLWLGFCPENLEGSNIFQYKE